MTIDNLFDVDCNNVHMVEVDSFEAAMPTKPSIVLATEKQLGFLKKLFAERQNNAEAMILRQHLLSEYRAGNLSVRMASQAIDDVMAMSKDQQKLVHNFEHGQIWMSTEGNYVKIQLNQAGTQFYGKIWHADWKTWEYAGKDALHTVDHICTAEEAKEFSLQWEAESRYCIFCMKHLSDERSEFAGYGEKCASNHGLPWGATA